MRWTNREWAEPPAGAGVSTRGARPAPGRTTPPDSGAVAGPALIIPATSSSFMNDLPPHPPRLLKAYAACAKWSLWLLAAFWLLLALAWGALHGWIVPRISEWRPALEAQATRALGVPVRIGAVRAH